MAEKKRIDLTEMLRLLKMMSDQAEEDIRNAAEKAKSNLEKKTDLRELQEAYQQIIEDHEVISKIAQTISNVAAMRKSSLTSTVVNAK